MVSILISIIVVPLTVVAHARLILTELLTDHGTCQLNGAVCAADGHITLMSVWVHLVAVTDLDGDLGVLQVTGRGGSWSAEIHKLLA